MIFAACPCNGAITLSNRSSVELAEQLCSRRGCHGLPYAHRFVAKPAYCLSGNQMALDVEGVVGGGVGIGISEIRYA